MQGRQASRRLSRTLAQLFLIIKEKSPIPSTGPFGERTLSQATESTVSWPSSQRFEGLSNVTRSASTRASQEGAVVGTADEKSRGPKTKEVLDLISRHDTPTKSTAKRNLTCLQADDLKPVLRRWGYETEGVRKSELVKRMHQALQEEEKGIAKKAEATKRRKESRRLAKEKAQEPAEPSVGALLQAARLQRRVAEVMTEAVPNVARPDYHAMQATPIAPRPQQQQMLLDTLTPDQVAEWLSEARTEDVVVLDVTDICPFADHLVIASGRSNQHVHAAASGVCWQIAHKVRDYQRQKTVYREGDEDSDWVAIDTGSIVVHVMTKEARELYDLEELWDKRHGSQSEEDADFWKEAHMGAL